MPRRRKEVADVRSLARSHTRTAIHTLAKIMTCHTSPPAARVQAAVMLMNRGWGSPSQEVHARIEGEHVIRWEE